MWKLIFLAQISAWSVLSTATDIWLGSTLWGEHFINKMHPNKIQANNWLYELLFDVEFCIMCMAIANSDKLHEQTALHMYN